MSLRCRNEPCRCGPFPTFVVSDSQRGGLLIGYGIKFLKLVFYTLKNVFVTGGAKELKCNSHAVENMTKVPRGFDFSFLNDEEARKILQVLERNEELQRAEKDRIRYRTNSFLFSRRLAPAGAPIPPSPRPPGARGGRRGAFAEHLSPRGAQHPRGELRSAALLRTVGCPAGWCSARGIPDGPACGSLVPQGRERACLAVLAGSLQHFSPSGSRRAAARPGRGHVGGGRPQGSGLRGGSATTRRRAQGPWGGGGPWAGRAGEVGRGRCAGRNRGARPRASLPGSSRRSAPPSTPSRGPRDAPHPTLTGSGSRERWHLPGGEGSHPKGHTVPGTCHLVWSEAASDWDAPSG